MKKNDKNYQNYKIISRLLSKEATRTVGENYCEEIEQLLIEHQIDVNYVPENKISLLNWALCSNYLDRNIEVIELLVARGADVNYVPKLDYKDTPLWKAIECGSTKAVKLFVDKGADVNYCLDGRSIWDLCSNRYFTNLTQTKNEIARLIVKSGKLVLKENDNVDYYNKIKTQIDFETKCENDIEWLKSGAVFSFKILSKMLNFYVNNYKTKFGDNKFFENCALKVEDAIKFKFHCESSKDSINNIFSSSKNGVIKFNIDEEKVQNVSVPKVLFAEIGKFVFEGTCYDIETSGNSSIVEMIEN